MNGCKCGFHGDPTRECRCTGTQIAPSPGKISGPLPDRIGLHVEVPAGASSGQMRERVLAARSQNQPIAAKHVAEAVQYRSLDRWYWG